LSSRILNSQLSGDPERKRKGERQYARKLIRKLFNTRLTSREIRNTVADEISKALPEESKGAGSGCHYLARHQRSCALPPDNTRQSSIHKLPPFADR